MVSFSLAQHHLSDNLLSDGMSWSSTAMSLSYQLVVTAPAPQVLVLLRLSTIDTNILSGAIIQLSSSVAHSTSPDEVSPRQIMLVKILC